MRDRATAALAIISSPTSLRSPGVIPALITLLDRENRLIADSFRRGIGVSAEYGENYGEYYGKLISSLVDAADLQDPRTLHIIASGSYNPDSELALKLADKGGARLVPVASQLFRSELIGTRWNALALLGRLYEKRETHRLPSATAKSVKQLIVEGIDDKATRRQAVELLAQVGSPEDLPLLQRIAASDPQSYIHDKRGRIFPVRDLAAQAIHSIQQRSR